MSKSQLSERLSECNFNNDLSSSEFTLTIKSAKKTISSNSVLIVFTVCQCLVLSSFRRSITVKQHYSPSEPRALDSVDEASSLLQSKNTNQVLMVSLKDGLRYYQFARYVTSVIWSAHVLRSRSPLYINGSGCNISRKLSAALKSLQAASKDDPGHFGSKSL